MKFKGTVFMESYEAQFVSSALDKTTLVDCTVTFRVRGEIECYQQIQEMFNGQGISNQPLISIGQGDGES